jgi:hypothetical protein
MAQGSSVSVEHFPVVIITMGEELLSDDLQRMKAAFQTIFARRKKYVCITDVRGIKKLPDAKGRQEVADWWKTLAPDQRIWNLGNASVVASAPVRGALTALSWLFTSPTPQVYVADMSAALEWADERLRQADLELPRSVEALRAVG